MYALMLAELVSESGSTFPFQKQNKSNSISSKDDIIEKGETDSLRKENESEDDEKENEGQSKEKRFKQDYHLNSFPNQMSRCSTEPENKGKGMKIVMSVSVNDIKNSPPKIVFQRSHEPLSEEPKNSAPLPSIMKINCSGSCMKLEIQLDSCDFNTTFVFVNEKGEGAETSCFRSKSERTSILNNDQSDHPSHHRNVINQTGTQDIFNYQISFGSVSEEKDAEKNSGSVFPARMRDDDDNNSNFTLASPPLSPSTLLHLEPKGKHFCKSFGSDEFWDIPPPHEFADMKYNTLEDVTHDLALCRIAACGSINKHQTEFHPTANNVYNKECFPFSVDEDERTDRLSESENFDPMFLRPSSSASMSSFTKDFISCQRRKSWIRNNSIAILEHKEGSFPKKRRQTFPGMSEIPGLMEEDVVLPCRECSSSGTISSFIMHLLPLQTERLGRFYQSSDMFSAFGIGCFSRSSGNDKPSGFLNSHAGNENCVDPFCCTNLEENCDDVFDEHFEEQSDSSHCPLEDSAQHETNLERSVYEDVEDQNSVSGGDQVEQSEVADSGFNQDPGEAEYQSPGAVTDDLPKRVVAPSPSGSEEQTVQNNPMKFLQNGAEEDDSVSVLPKHSKNSVLTITVGDLEQRSLQADCRSSQESSKEKQRVKNLSSAVKEPCQAAVLDTQQVQSLNTNEVTDGIQATSEGPSAGKTSTTSPASSPMNSLQQEEGRGGGDSDKPAACLTNGSTDQDTESCGKEELCKAKNQMLCKASSEMKEHLTPSVHKNPDSTDRWTKRRKLFKDSRQWSSAGGSSITSDITEESVSEDAPSMDMSVGDGEDRGFYTETFHSAAWIYRGDDVSSADIPPNLRTRPPAVSSKF
ncbi:hypothetical protein LDENG_00272620 [Lucifuga dentata]|nr:hypothetical protein LDENG_00272620 [Lucifuga dentata]